VVEKPRRAFSKSFVPVWAHTGEDGGDGVNEGGKGKSFRERAVTRMTMQEPGFSAICHLFAKVAIYDASEIKKEEKFHT